MVIADGKLYLGSTPTMQGSNREPKEHQSQLPIPCFLELRMVEYETNKKSRNIRIGHIDYMVGLGIGGLTLWWIALASRALSHN